MFRNEAPGFRSLVRSTPNLRKTRHEQAIHPGKTCGMATALFTSQEASNMKTEGAVSLL